MNINQKIINNINNNYELDKNLQDYVQRLTSGYNDYSMVKLALEYINLYESNEEFSESFASIDKCLENTKAMELINTAIKEGVISETKEEEVRLQCENVKALRSKLTSLMDYILLITSKLSKVEYIFNRIEGKFLDEMPKYNVNDTVNEIMMYLFEDKDNVVINDKLSLIIPELPIRITKGKILSRISDVMTLYKGDDYSALKYFIYSLTNAAGITYSAKRGYDVDYVAMGITTFLDEEIKCFDNVNYEELTKEEFFELKDKMSYYVSLIKEVSDGIIMYMETINALVCVLSTKLDNLKLNPNTTDICCNLLDEVMTNGMYNDNIPTDNGIVRDVFVMLSSLEGQAEKFGPENEYMFSALDSIENCHEDKLIQLGLKEKFDNIRMCDKLCSTSYFFELEDNKLEDKVDDVILKQENEILLGKLKEVLDNASRIERRAYISLIMTQLPNEFTNSNQIKEYVINSLEMCSDQAELAGCIGAINSAIRGVW